MILPYEGFDWNPERYTLIGDLSDLVELEPRLLVTVRGKLVPRPYDFMAVDDGKLWLGVTIRKSTGGDNPPYLDTPCWLYRTDKDGGGNFRSWWFMPLPNCRTHIHRVRINNC